MVKSLTGNKQSSNFEFTERQKEKIYKRYDNRCALCGLGKEDGVEIHVVHVGQGKKNGKVVAENGLLLCTEHNKTRYDANADNVKIHATLMLKVAKHKKDKGMETFYSEVLGVYENYNINSQTEWKEDSK